MLNEDYKLSLLEEEELGEDEGKTEETPPADPLDETEEAGEESAEEEQGV